MAAGVHKVQGSAQFLSHNIQNRRACLLEMREGNLSWDCSHTAQDGCTLYAQSWVADQLGEQQRLQQHCALVASICKLHGSEVIVYDQHGYRFGNFFSSQPRLSSYRDPWALCLQNFSEQLRLQRFQCCARHCHYTFMSEQQGAPF